MSRTVEFPKLDPPWDFYRQCVRFYALDGRVVRGCLVPGEALFEHFGVRKPDPDECLQAFRNHRSAIEEAARRKILSEPASRAGGEVLLRVSDFNQPSSTTTSTTTTQPPQFGRLAVKLSPALVGNAVLRRSVDAANSILDAEMVRPGMRIHADWDVVPPVNGITLVEVTLSDAETEASAQKLFTQDDLEDASSVRYALFRLWDELFRERGRRLMLALSDAGGSGG